MSSQVANKRDAGLMAAAERERERETGGNRGSFPFSSAGQVVINITYELLVIVIWFELCAERKTKLVLDL